MPGDRNYAHCSSTIVTAPLFFHRLRLSASDVLSLRGGGLAYRLSPGPRRPSGEVVSLEFKTARSSGTLLQAEGEGGLGLSLELERGKLLLLTRGTERHVLVSHLTKRFMQWDEGSSNRPNLQQEEKHLCIKLLDLKAFKFELLVPVEDLKAAASIFHRNA